MYIVRRIIRRSLDLEGAFAYTDGLDIDENLITLSKIRRMFRLSKFLFEMFVTQNNTDNTHLLALELNLGIR